MLAIADRHFHTPRAGRPRVAPDPANRDRPRHRLHRPQPRDQPARLCGGPALVRWPADDRAVRRRRRRRSPSGGAISSGARALVTAAAASIRSMAVSSPSPPAARTAWTIRLSVMRSGAIPACQKFLRWSILPQATVDRSRCSASVVIGERAMAIADARRWRMVRWSPPMRRSCVPLDNRRRSS